jgi:hypothetical protein
LRANAGSVRIALATVVAESKVVTTKQQFPWLNQSDLAALLTGSLVVLIGWVNWFVESQQVAVIKDVFPGSGNSPGS